MGNAGNGGASHIWKGEGDGKQAQNYARALTTRLVSIQGVKL